jgi:hypothetical protein
MTVTDDAHMPGTGYLFSQLRDNQSSVDAWQRSVGKKIAALCIDDERDGRLVFTFDDGFRMALYDDARSCCEQRYMTTDDNLSYFVGATLIDADVSDGPYEEDEYGEPHEQAFLRVTTSLGVFTVVTHNEHNGYYGGISIRAAALDRDEPTNTETTQ